MQKTAQSRSCNALTRWSTSLLCRSLFGRPVLDEVVDMPAIVRVVFFVLKIVEVPQLQYLVKVVDVFFVQFIDSVDVPVLMQRRGLRSVLGQGR